MPSRLYILFVVMLFVCLTITACTETDNSSTDNATPPSVTTATALPPTEVPATPTAQPTEAQRSEQDFPKDSPFAQVPPSEIQEAEEMAVDPLLSARTVTNSWSSLVLGDVGYSVMPGEVFRLLVLVDSVEAVFFRAFSTGQISLTLRTPDQQIIDEGAAYADSQIIYLPVFGLIEERHESFPGYLVRKPMVGEWEVLITSRTPTSVTVLAEANSSLRFVATYEGPLAKAHKVEVTNFGPGEKVHLEAALLDFQAARKNIAVTGTLNNILNEPLQPLVFYDDGTQGDVTAEDGIYTSEFLAPNLAGYGRERGEELFFYSLVVSDGASVRVLSDELRVFASISNGQSTNASLTGEIREDVIDEDRDGLFDRLVISVTTVITRPSQFELFGSLVDAKGNQIDRLFFNPDPADEAIQPGTRQLTLTISGSALRSYGMDGPYRLDYVSLDDRIGYGSVKIGSIEDALVTRPYKAAQFENPPPQIIDGHDTAVDLDDDGKYDELQISLNLAWLNPGVHEWSGMLWANPDGLGGIGMIVTGSVEVGITNPVTLIIPWGGQVHLAMDGPYVLDQVTLKQITGIGADGKTLTVVGKYTTNVYQHKQFAMSQSAAILTSGQSHYVPLPSVVLPTIPGELVIDAESSDFSLVHPGQVANLTFYGKPRQTLKLNIASEDLGAMEINIWHQQSGDQLAYLVANGTQSFDLASLPKEGIYEIVLSSSQSQTGTFQIGISQKTD